ncbi:hypothetical protein [Leptolyngbya sp. FACHB-261]|uniref:hypothetical protein n=1 Tax=Leptolyngbya sp. FACHB-261 TaxID=2692806 RepID=UPI00168952D7|nr:hypothetical protein [Leptolyngbya sp. FACHB-261]MBD2102471.1 hypothetical protein [Leptolyngbya sp. FACHB-261]
MSKFQDLCQIYNQSHSEMADYLESCVQFIETLIKGLEVYLDIPAKRLQYRDRDGEERTLREAMYLENGVWHFDMAITMCPESAYRLRTAAFTRCYYPRQTVVLPFVMKKVMADVSIVGFENYPKQFSVNISDKTSVADFCQFVFRALEAYYKNIFQMIMDNNESPRKLEFKCLEPYL